MQRCKPSSDAAVMASDQGLSCWLTGIYMQNIGKVKRKSPDTPGTTNEHLIKLIMDKSTR